MIHAGFFIEELFQFDDKWYGFLLSVDDANFKRFVIITRFFPGGCDWDLLDGTLESAVKYFYEKDRS